MKTFDPYPALDTSTPEMPGKSPLEHGSNVGRRRKKFRFDNAKTLGQKRAIEQLEQNPKKIEVPQLMK